MAPDPAQTLVREMRRMLDDAGDLEQRIRQAVTRQAAAPFEAVFDLLAESGTMLQRQAEALEAAGQALQDAAALMQTQALLFERSIGALRQPLDVAQRVAGIEKPQKDR